MTQSSHPGLTPGSTPFGQAAATGARGFVVNYLDFHWRGCHWPAFNRADAAITIGAGARLTSMSLSIIFAIGKKAVFFALALAGNTADASRPMGFHPPS